MGAIAEAIVAYAQPLIDASDGSMEQVQKALTMSQFCWNLALLPDDLFADALAHLHSSMKMEDSEFAELTLSVIAPMMLRHREMFPNMRKLGGLAGLPISELPAPSNLGRSGGRGRPSIAERPEPPKKQAAVGPYEPCPCGSGRKYKFCCKQKK